MRLIQQRSAEAECLGNLTQRPQLMTPVFYSPWGEPAVVASMPAAWHFAKRNRESSILNLKAKESLAFFLTQRLLERKPSEIILKSEPWGKPEIWLNGVPGPALSFSWSAKRLWAAAGRPGNSLGLDAAAPEEFAGSYPHRRVFAETERQTAITLSRGDAAEAAALLWSVKEAVVKAAGCGFYYLSPKQVQVRFTGQGESGYLWRGCLQGIDQDGNRANQDHYLAVSVRLEYIWLAVAWCVGEQVNLRLDRR
jgi:phosphopantetheinyl transferase